MMQRQRGQIQILFALFLVVFLLLIGGAVDYAGIVAEEARLQNATDAAALAAAQSLAQNAGQPLATVQAAAGATAVAYYSSNGYPTRPDVQYTIAFPTATPAAGGTPSPYAQTTDITATENYNTMFWGLAKVPSVRLNAHAAGSVPGPLLDVFITVDETSSMSSHDEQQVSAAAANFVTALNPSSSNPLSTRIGIAQFQGFRYYAQWADSGGSHVGFLHDSMILTHLTTDQQKLLRITNNTGSYSGCPTLPTLQPPVPYGTLPTTQTWSSGNVSKVWWFLGTPYRSNPPASSGIPVINSASSTMETPTRFGCPLTSDPVSSGTYIKNGVTAVYVPGVWDAWQSAPEGARPSAHRVLVLMTDGDNNKTEPDPANKWTYLTWNTGCTTTWVTSPVDWWNGKPWCWSSPDAWAAMQNQSVSNSASISAATAARNAGIEIFTVGFFSDNDPEVPGGGSESQLTGPPALCPAPVTPASASTEDQLLISMSSSSPGSCDHYYPLSKQQGSLPGVFSAIAARIKRMRLTS